MVLLGDIIFYRCLKTYIVLLVLVVAETAMAVNGHRLSELYYDCVAGNKQSTIGVCEDYFKQGGSEYSAYMKLANLYRKNNQLDKAAVIYEQALDRYGASFRLKRHAREMLSNSKEQVWLKKNSTKTDVALVDRAKCINLSNTLPKLAVKACDQYLATNPKDQEAEKYKQIALKTLSDKALGDKALGDKAKAVASKKESSPRPKHQVASANDVVKRKPEKTSKPAKKPKSNQEHSVEVASVKTASQNEAVDQNTIIELRKELKNIYALIDKQKKTSSFSVANKYNELGRRYALVVGNGDYSKDIGRLKNPVNDAKDIAKTLEKLGFRVTLLLDTNHDQLERAINRIASETKSDDTTLFYYAGHAVAIDGENYMLPTKTAIKDIVDVKYKSLNLSYVLEKLDRGNTGVTIVILDACRNNPFPNKRGSSGGGLANVAGPVGTFIAYATAPGNVASDGRGRNGVYTKHLLSQMQKPNIKLEDVFKRVRVGVESETNGAQVPWENSSLRGDFYFNYSG